MSLYQCEFCGCCENTALGAHIAKHMPDLFDWAGMEESEGKLLCSACGPTKYCDGTATKYGRWHGRFERVFLPMGQFKTAHNGNLEHIETGDQDFRKYAISRLDAQREQEGK